MVAIIDYGAGNLMSISKAVLKLGFECSVTSDPDTVRRARSVILPGVGAFGPAAGFLRSTGMDAAVREAAGEGRPLLGICLGMQLMFEGSEEGEGVAGLELLKGRVSRLPAGIRVPHLGWNTVESQSGPLFAGLDGERWFYFAHSYSVEPVDPAVVTSHTTHGIRFPSSISSGAVCGVQFHPEKSGAAGLELLDNFLRLGL
ncbi:MAG: imidazole glycerol phosphate synthase subunit HisH [Firmicutes bacterium]|nr:imidazole glycerol phosphate synthase subunit HisH [Bacillota bacterium]